MIHNPYARIILAGLLLLSSCGKDPQLSEVVDGPSSGMSSETLTARIEAVREGAGGTKTTYDSIEGQFKWNKDDAIAVHFSGGSYVTATVDPVTHKVSFASRPAGQTRDYYAVYPASAAVAANYGKPTLQVKYPDTYDMTDIIDGKRSFEESLCPMVAVNDPAKDQLDFYHVGGLLRMRMSLLDARSAFVRFTFNKDVTGTYTVSNPGTDHPTITSRGNNSGNVVTFTLNNGQGIGYRIYNEPFMINVPVPCGTYENVKVEILDASGSIQESATIDRAITFARHHGKKIPFLTFCDRELTSAYVPGKFSVSDTKSVFFASGNLVVENTLQSNGVNKRVWKFEEDQRNYNTDIHPTLGYSVEGQTYKISYFGWATAGVKNHNGNYGYNSTHFNYEPHSLLTDENVPSQGFGARLSWEDNPEVRMYCDWGVHFDDAGNGSDTMTNGTWYTLSSSEWDYLLQRIGSYSRSPISHNTSYTLLFPDVFSSEALSNDFFRIQAPLTDFMYYIAINAGVVVLPNGGMRICMDINTFSALYWTSTYYTSIGSSDFAFHYHLPGNKIFEPKSHGTATGGLVRLVHD